MDTLKRLIDDNKKYINSTLSGVDVSPELRRRTAVEGQHPYAAIVACADSRVPVESIFSAGIGELFTVRVAGNVIGDMELASLDYATGHLGIKLVVVLGHTHCGAVGAALHGHADGLVAAITEEISHAIGNEKDELTACRLNVQNSVKKIKQALSGDINVVGAIYDIESGYVDFLS